MLQRPLLAVFQAGRRPWSCCTFLAIAGIVVTCVSKSALGNQTLREALLLAHAFGGCGAPQAGCFAAVCPYCCNGNFMLLSLTQEEWDHHRQPYITTYTAGCLWRSHPSATQPPSPVFAASSLMFQEVANMQFGPGIYMHRRFTNSAQASPPPGAALSQCFS